MIRTENGEREQKTVFLICPVRGVTEEENALIEEYVVGLESDGVVVYWPKRDTDQEDSIGLRICEDNRAAIESADEVHIWFNPRSTGSIFDLGMTFALRKKIVLVNPEMVEPTEGKSFNNVLLALSSLTEE